MTSKLVRIDPDRCDGCALCVEACHEGALAMVNGKAVVVRENQCDGLGACLPVCPQGALTLVDVPSIATTPGNRGFEVRSGAPAPAGQPPHGGCPGSREQRFQRSEREHTASNLGTPNQGATPDAAEPSELSHWPVQLTLVSPRASFLQGADLLLCADCVPFAVPDFHTRYLRGRVVLVGCPKLDDIHAYAEKLSEIFEQAQPRSVTVLRMEVPCCGGLASIALSARDAVLPTLPVEVHTIGIRGGSFPQTGIFTNLRKPDP